MARTRSRPTKGAPGAPAPDELAVERVPIGSVRPDPENARRHPDRNLDAIKASLARFGQQKPIVVDADGIVRAGNGTLAAALALGWDAIAVVRTSLRGHEATAYALADNRAGDLAEWDDDALVARLREIDGSGVSFDGLGWDDDELAAMLDDKPAGDLPPAADGKEFDESIADEVEHLECPACGHRWPK